MEIKFTPYENITPQVYAYITPDVRTHDGWIKIGHTEKQTVEARVRQQCRTAAIRYEIKWHEPARYTGGSNKGEYFKDHPFHDHLTKFWNIERWQENGKYTEWFKIDAEKSHRLFKKFAAQNYDGIQIADDHEDYTLRAEQQDAVEQTLAYYKNNKSLADCHFLWNAKPRFGKTLATYDFMCRMDAKNVLIVTNRPAIANSWYDDFCKFIKHKTTYLFVSETEALSDKGVLNRKQYLAEAERRTSEDRDADVRQVAFESLQGLKGSIYFGGEYDKLQWIKNTEWDLLVIDEAHEGVDTYKTDTAFREIRRKFTLHLSGTPFKAIAAGKFGSKQIYNWTFADEQEAKEKWYAESEEYNPYAAMPRMNLFTYQMSKIIEERVSQGVHLSEGENAEYAFDLNEFFKTKNDGKFVYEKDVLKFLKALVENEKFPFSTPELRQQMAHTFWIMERVDSAKAMAKLLKDHPVFENYEVVIAAGDGRLEGEEGDADAKQSRKSLEKVRDAIKNHEKTITLSVGQLTTGVTIPEWTAVFMLSNMRSSAEYIQAAFRAQNPHRFEKNGKCYQKENAYIFDFAPERTLMVYDEFANSLYSATAAGGGSKAQREENIKRLLNFFSVYAEDGEGRMTELDAAQVLSVPIKIKTEEVVKRGFMSNFLFANISNVFGAPAVVREILEQIKPETEQGRMNGGPGMDDMEEVRVNASGDVEIPQEIIVAQTKAIFGEKVYEASQERVAEVFAQSVSQQQAGNSRAEERKTPALVASENLAQDIKNAITATLVEKAKEEYALTKKQAEKIAARQQVQAAQELENFARDFDRQQNIMQLDKEKELRQAATEAEKIIIEKTYAEKSAQAQQDFRAKLTAKADQVAQQAAQEGVRVMETQREEKKKRDIESDIRAHLRGFARTIPSFIMAYGDDELTLANFENYPPAGVFQEVTSISVEQFRFLRDGGDYVDENGESRHFAGQLFDEVVFNESIKAFLEKKRALANYFDETHTEDIFDYIPPQETNQIFTPKKVVQMMVDQLEENEPHIFDYPDKTFVDFYMKSGLYITEIAKRLYRNPLMKNLFPDDAERIKHILECQVFGFAPTQIIYDIAISYIFGFDEGAHKISRRNFFARDTLPAAKEGKLQELVNEVLRGRAE